MNNNKHLFYDKITSVFNIICKKDLSYFTKLFHAKNSSTSEKHRQIHLKNSWLAKPSYSKMFKKEYSQYPFSRLMIGSRPIFRNGDEFLEVDAEEFYERIKRYMEQDIELKSETKDIYYRYMYIFNLNGIEENHSIDYYKINYIDSTLSHEIEIEVEPPQHKSSLSIEPYHGKLKSKNSKIILSFENQTDYISAVFNRDLISNQTKYLVGVGIGIADINQKIPISKKVLLTKEIVEDVDELYFTLNESEIISAKENSYKFKDNNKDYRLSHLEKYSNKILKLNMLFKNLSRQKHFSSFYEQLAFKEFSAVQSIFAKLKENHGYFVNHRKRVLDVLLKSQEYENYQALYIVMPIDGYENIFEHQSSKALALQDEMLKMGEKIKVEILFVVANYADGFSHEFSLFLEKAAQKIEIRFALKHEVDKEINSIDFIFTDRVNFLVSRFLRVDNPVFNLFQDKATIEEHEAMYRKILNRSVGYEEMMSGELKDSVGQNPIIETLTGEWNLYTYGSWVDSEGETKFWEDRMVVYEDGVVEYFSEGKKIGLGEIIIKKSQSIILFEGIESQRLFSISFDHLSHKIQKAFVVKIVSKQYHRDSDMMVLGICSRKPIERAKAQEILGEVESVRVLESGKIYDDLANYLIDEYGYYDDLEGLL